MIDNEKVTEALVSFGEQLLAKSRRAVLAAGEVAAVDKSARTIDVRLVSDGRTLEGVRLQAVESRTTGLVVFPPVGSAVIVAELEAVQSEAVVIAQAETEAVELDVNGKAALTIDAAGAVSLDAEKITLNGEGFGGLVKLPVLQQEIGKISNYLNTLRTTLSSPSTPVTPNDGGKTFGAAVGAALGPLPLPNLQNAGNDNIKHG